MTTQTAPEIEPNTVFVSNLNYQTETEAFKNAFTQFGEVKTARIITETFRGQTRSRGIGFIEFASEAQANQAISAKTVSLDGRKVFIRQARKKVPRKNDTAFIGGIKEGTTAEQVKAAFTTDAPVDAKIVRYDQGERKGFAFVKFASKEARDRVVKASRTITINGSESILRFARHDFDRPPTVRPRRRRFYRRRAPKANPPTSQ